MVMDLAARGRSQYNGAAQGRDSLPWGTAVVGRLPGHGYHGSA
jgi:hypothetical protein